MLSDNGLLRQAAGGGREALRTIYEMHKDHLLTLARGLTGDRHTAEDVVHDVFVAFARNVPTLRLRSSLRAYLSVSVCNRVRDLARVAIRRRQEAWPAEVGSRDAAAPESSAATAELTERLREALGQLPLDQREVLLLRTRTGLSFKEIARLQGIPVNTAQGRYRYGIDKLRSLLNSELEP